LTPKKCSEGNDHRGTKEEETKSSEERKQTRIKQDPKNSLSSSPVPSPPSLASLSLLD
jgi:hypothetical protein